MASSGNAQHIEFGTSNSVGTDLGDEVISFNIDESAAVYPRGGAKTFMRNVSSNKKDFSISGEFDDDTAVRTLFQGKVGSTIFFEHGPEGNGSGKVKKTGSFILTSAVFTTAIDGKRTVSIQGVPKDAAITYGTY